MVDGLVGLAGALVGALIAAMTQVVSGWANQAHTRAVELNDACALFLALSEDYRNRVWFERQRGREIALLQEFTYSEYRLAEARVRLRASDQHLREALDTLAEANRALGAAWHSEEEATEVDRLLAGQREAIRSFATIACASMAPKKYLSWAS